MWFAQVIGSLPPAQKKSRGDPVGDKLDRYNAHGSGKLRWDLS